MAQDKVAEALNWYKHMQIDEVYSDKKYDYLAPEEKVGLDKSEKLIQEQARSGPQAINKQSQPALVSPIKAANQARLLANQARSLDELQQIVNEFKGCLLERTATKTVFAEGAKNADIMLIGEAPGATEDREGRPFCGDSGQLLDKALASINVSREVNAYITNAVFWRPPGNRRPTNEEIDICQPFVEKHIALLKPKMIILVGSTAATALLGKGAKVTELRKKYFNYKNNYLDKAIALTCLFHPAYLLRQPSQKKQVWHDLLAVKDYMAKL